MTHARITIIDAPPEGLRLWEQMVSDRIAPSAPTNTGFEEGIWLVDREAQRGLAVTLWDSQDAMDQADARAGENRDRLANATEGTIKVLRCEVVARAG